MKAFQANIEGLMSSMLKAFLVMDMIKNTDSQRHHYACFHCYTRSERP